MIRRSLFVLMLLLPTTGSLAACTRGAAAPAAAERAATSAAATATPDDDRFEGTAPPDQRVPPPPPGVTPDWTFPAIHHMALDNELALRVVQQRSLPIVEIRLVVLTGSAADGEKPGLGVVAGELLKAGGTGAWSSRQLLEKAESLGSDLVVLTDRDTTRISMAVARDNFEEAMDIVGAVATRPRFSYEEFVKLKRREMDRVSSLARTNASWAASMVLHRELFRLPTAQHPYARPDASPEQIEKILLPDCRKWHQEHFTPRNAFLVVAGDVTPEQVRAAVEKSLGGWKGKVAPKPTFTRPMPPNGIEVHLVDRPGSSQSEIYVATLGPERQSDEWAAIKATNQVLGGGVAGRLFLDVREKRSLAYRTRSELHSVANGPVPIVLSAGTQTARAGLALQALLEHFDRIGSEAPSEQEVSIATKYLSDVFLVSVDTVAAVAELTAALGIYNLDDDHYDEYRAAVRQIDADEIRAVASRYFRPGSAVVVVAGDAGRLAKPLSHFGDVHVVDPDKGFVTTKKVAHDPSQSIELPRIDGT